MDKIRIEAFVSVPPCSGGVAVKRLLNEIKAEYGDQVEIVFHTGPGDKEWEEYAINNAPALVIGDLVKFVGLAPSKESLIGALREAGLA
jgi:predicted DsbA family dithiol-disulfide isomerase